VSDWIDDFLGEQPAKTESVPDQTTVESDEETPRAKALRIANHRSGCGLDVSELGARILRYFRQHGHPEDWHSLFTVFSDKSVEAWTKWGKGSSEILLAVMVSDGAIEVQGKPRMIRGRQPGTMPSELVWHDPDLTVSPSEISAPSEKPSVPTNPYEDLGSIY